MTMGQEVLAHKSARVDVHLGSEGCWYRDWYGVEALLPDRSKGT